MSPPLSSNDPFSALADPTRRHLVEMLVGHGPTTATQLASELDITRQAVAKHLYLLADAGLATQSRQGRETHFEARPEGLSEVAEWISTTEQKWDARLQNLADSLSPPEG